MVAVFEGVVLLLLLSEEGRLSGLGDYRVAVRQIQAFLDLEVNQRALEYPVALLLATLTQHLPRGLLNDDFVSELAVFFLCEVKI